VNHLPSAEQQVSADAATVRKHGLMGLSANGLQPQTMRDRLLALLQREWVTPLEALQQCGCLSLSQRCGEFRREGIRVSDRWVDLPNGKRVKAYRVEAS
jgi:hypothetical protein